MLDALVIGAGPAGIAAARTLQDAGRAVEIVEARSRVGGRAHTVAMDGVPVDLGAHWLHMAEHNPLVKLARAAGFASRRAPDDNPIYDEGGLVFGARRRAMRQGWSRLDSRLRSVWRSGEDQPLSLSLPDLGEWTQTFAFGIGLYSGADVRDVSAIDFYRTEDGSNRFLKDGYGALIAHLAEQLTIRLDCPATAIRIADDRAIVETAAGAIEAAHVIVTIPVALLKAGALTITPALPADVASAIASFAPGAYEHAIVRWPDSPFHGNGADQLTFLRSDGPSTGASMLTCIGGSDLHYVELGGAQTALWGKDPDDWKRRHVEALLSRHFGPSSADADILHMTDWWSDPWSRSSWSVCPPGASSARDALRQFDGERLRFASEATSPSQWGTVGGAWLEGARAARKIIGVRRLWA